MLRPDWDEYFSMLALLASARSTCPRKQVGCVIVDSEHRIIGTGYNGSLPGHAHCSEAGCLMVNGGCQRTIHAEKNALEYAVGNLAGATAYITLQPCLDCAKDLIKRGIQRVVYQEQYRNNDGIDVLQAFGVYVEYRNNLLVTSRLSRFSANLLNF